MDLRDRLQTTLGNAYSVERELGGGGMSRVFLAEEASLGRRVVVKILPPDTAAAVNVERFKREIALAARLQHPHIVPLLSAGEMDGVPYFTMPFVEGESLRVRLAHRGELPIAEAMRILRETASALAYAHERGVVHRDVKPDNILISGGAAMVTDFGVAKAIVASGGDAAAHSSLTSLGVALGTPAYMAPEQASADPATDHRADIYALGCVAYELLVGVPPFAGRSPQAMLAAHVQEEPESIAKRRPNLPPALAALIMRCLAKRAADRPQTAAEVVHALDDITTPSGGMQPTSALPATGAVTGAATLGGWRVPLFAIGLIAVGAVAFFIYRSIPHGAAPATADAAAPALKSVAVLPFVNVGGDTANEYFADGMTDEVTSALSKVGGLRVASRTSAFAYKGQKGTDVRTVGKALSVGAVLEGTVRRAAGRVRITAQLTNSADGLAVWSETYERDVKDVFAVQDELARSIAGALQVSLGSTTAVNAHRGETKDPEAHDLYLRARFHSNKYTEEGLRTAITLFEQALKRDPSYGRAWDGIANTWGRLADDFIAPREALPHLQEALAHAAAIDSLDPDLHAQRSIAAFWYGWDLAAAQREFSRTIELDPSRMLDQDFALSYISYLIVVGQRDSARAVIRRLVDADPSSVPALRTGIGFAQSGDTATALEYARRLKELEPGNRWALGALVKFRADSDLARILSNRGKETGPRDRTNNYLAAALAYARLGQSAEARQEIARARAEQKGSYIREENYAVALLVLGERDSAMTWLERGYESRSATIAMLSVDEIWRPLRPEPRFKRLLERAGLAAYVK